MKSIIKPAFYVLGLLLFLTSCYPDGPEYSSDYNLIGTTYDPDFNFGEAQTFALPDSIVFIKDKGDNKVYLTKDQETQIVNNIRDHLTSMGWIDSTYATVDTLPDVLVMVTGMATKYSGGYWNYWDWGWGYPGWGYPGWGWGYYPGYGYPVYYEFTTGSLILDMVDYKNLDSYRDSDTAPFIWAGALNGLVNRTPVNTSGILQAVDKIFELSPYLNKNN
jgi:hypothetical protein